VATSETGRGAGSILVSNALHGSPPDLVLPGAAAGERLTVDEPASREAVLEGEESPAVPDSSKIDAMESTKVEVPAPPACRS
jgi:hypothetical protein